MISICVFCGANEGVLPEYRQSALALTDILVRQGVTQVYGGGNIGLIGVMPVTMMDREVGHTALTQMHVVADRHERKKQLTRLSDAFIALPGSAGTTDELFQEVVLQQTGCHDKVCGLLNTEHYYDHLVALIEHAAG